MIKHAALHKSPETGVVSKPQSHGEILKLIWKHLDLGALDRNHPFHTPVFATVADGFPEVRMVVLRRFWRKPAAVAFHAHAGSPKVLQLKENPGVSWQFYHPTERLQVRVRGLATVHTDDELADEQWAASELLARRCYVGVPPTTATPQPWSGLPDGLADRRPTPAEVETGRVNFVVVRTAISEIDCLELSIRGHRRSLFTWEDGELRTRWLTP